MAETATITTADGIAKRVHGKIQNMVPSKHLKVSKRIKYDKSREVGLEYAELVWLTAESGFTAGGTTGARINLNRPSVAESKLAKLSPSAIHFRTEVTHDLLKQAESAGEKAFESYISALYRNSKKAMDRRQEIRRIYAGSSLASVTSATDAGTSSVITINEGTWAAGIWVGSRGTKLDAYNGSTLLNTLGAFTVSAVNVKDRKITVTGAGADVDALVAAGSSAQLYFEGYKGKDGTGLITIAGLNSSSGTYLGISCADYSDVWNATQKTWDYSTTEFTWNLLHEGLEEAADRGMEGDVIVQVPFLVWRQLCGSLDALRVLDSSYSAQKAEMGHELEALTYHAITGKATIEPSMYQMRGKVIAYADPADSNNDCAVIGTTEPTFELPGTNGRFVQHVHGTNAVEFGMFACDDIWLPAPRNCVLWGA